MWVGGFGWRFGVGLHLDGDADRIILVASSGTFLSLEHGGCQMF
jgi:phosphomannomutase